MTIHEAAIRLLKRDYEGLETKGFRRSVCALDILQGRKESDSYPDLVKYVPADDESFPIDWKAFRDWKEPPEFNRIPDAFFIDFHSQMAVVFEVEDTNRISMEKLNDYYELYFEHLDPLGWGLALISVDRWGKRTPVQFFDYVFSEMIEKIPDQTLLKAIQCAADIEYRYAVAICEGNDPANSDDLFKLISDARLHTDYIFWQSSQAKRAFDKIMKER